MTTAILTEHGGGNFYSGEAMIKDNMVWVIEIGYKYDRGIYRIYTTEDEAFCAGVC